MRDYPLAKEFVFATTQGEGLLLGLPMVFVRLAGCPVGCAECDTDYRPDSRAGAADIAVAAASVRSAACEWAWVTGGEPTIHDLGPLFTALRRAGFRVALATAGVRPIAHAPDFLSVSPHRLDSSWLVRRGDQCNLVPGLNGLTLADVEAADSRGEFAGFGARWLTPAAGIDPGPCLEFVGRRPGWRAGVQAHRVWGVA